MQWKLENSRRCLSPFKIDPKAFISWEEASLNEVEVVVIIEQELNAIFITNWGATSLKISNHPHESLSSGEMERSNAQPTCLNSRNLLIWC